MFKYTYRDFLFFIIFTAIYICSAKVGLLLAFEHVNISPVWPPTGISVALILIYGVRVWPVIFIGAFIINVDVIDNFLLSMIIAIGNTLEAIVTGCITLKYASQKPFSKIFQTVVFIISLILGTLISASIGVLSLFNFDVIVTDRFLILWETWWVGDLIGGIVITPLILTWRHLPNKLLSKTKWLEVVLLLSATIFVLSYIFGIWQQSIILEEITIFFLLPLICWAALRFHHYGATLIVFIITIVSVVCTINGAGPFVLNTPNESLLVLQTYIGTVMFTSLLIMATQEERKRAYYKLRLNEKNLEATVLKRTRELNKLNKLLEAEISHQRHITDSLKSLLYYIDLSSKDDFYIRCTEALSMCFKAKYSLIGIFENEEKKSIKTLGFWANGVQANNFTYELKDTPCADVLDSKMEFISSNAAKIYSNDLVLSEMGIESYFGAPLIDTSGEAIGILVVMDTQPSYIDSALKALMGLFSKRVSFELQTRVSTEELELAASVFNESLEAIFICDVNNHVIRVNPEFTKVTGYSFAEVKGKDPRFWKSGQHSKDFYVSLWEGLTSKGFWQGELINKRKNGEYFVSRQIIKAVKDDNDKILQFIGMFSDITEKKQIEEQIYQLAHHDLVTQLPNRVSFHRLANDAIKNAEKNSHQIAIMFIDLDNFKLINDTSGHPVGDELLVQVANRLNALLLPQHVISRFGGDEFTVLLNDIEVFEKVGIIAKSILEILREPFVLSSCELTISASIGISIYPENGVDVSTLLSCSDNAMYRAKSNGRDSFEFYTEQMKLDAQERMLLERELRLALKDHQFILHYQPQIDINTNKIIGVEALIRWQHPSIGLIPPDKFIPIAESTGLIVQIGDWVIKEACKQLRLWKNNGVDHLTMAINLSARQLFQSDLFKTIEQVILKEQVDASKLEFEITESMMMMNIEEIIATLHKLRSLGVQLSIDDFGTGYSSLSYLKRFPLNKLKIDKSFVDGLPDDADDLAIVQSIIAIAHTLKLTVIAEGVENLAQLNLLKEYKCNEFQGYLYSCPLPANDLKQYFNKAIFK